MAITIGTQLGSHEIIALLGKGGMGEVYRARDTKLKREVAVKILPDEFSNDSQRVTRFQREAEVLASLNHPNIAGIHDVQESQGIRYLVLELVEGETLATKLRRGALPVTEALTVAKNICEALEAAHEKGVIHRDLKPANVKITPEGTVKVLDFGLAKAVESSPNTSASNSPTLSMAATQAGVILGTAAYMSPEQAKGLTADARSDVFSLGCVLYEMLTGRQAFHFDTTTEILAAILMRDPDFGALPPNLSPRIKELLRRCLEKSPKRRWQAIGDLRAELETITSSPDTISQPIPLVVITHASWRRTIVTVAALIVLSAIAGFVGYKLRPPSTASVMRFPLVLPDGQRLLTAVASHVVAISPDGTRLVYLANAQLFLRSMSEMEARPIAGVAATDSVQAIAEPFFSPDGQWVGFYSRADATLKKIAVTGGTPITLCKTDSVSGVTWDGDQIWFARLREKGIMRVSANGGEPQEVIPRGQSEALHGPQVINNGRSLLFTVTTDQGQDRWDKAQIVMQSLDSGERKVVIRGGSDARYLPTGHLVYAIAGTVFAVPFDDKSGEIHGSPVPVIEGVMRASYTNTAAAHFAISAGGMLVYIPGTASTGQTRRTLGLADRTGKARAISLPPQNYLSPRVSPDGKQVAFGTNDNNDAIIWIYDLKGGSAPRRLTFGGRNERPLWIQDGKSIAFLSNREGDNGLFQLTADGSGSPQRVTKSTAGNTHYPESWNSSTNVLTYFNEGTGSNARALMMLPFGADQKEKPIFPPAVGLTEANSTFSPDGRWIAYNSNEPDGRSMHVFVQPFPPTGAKYQLPGDTITTLSFVAPLWSPDGKQLIYGVGQGTDQLLAVDVQTAPTFIFGKPTPFRIEGFIGGDGTTRNYDLTPDGKQFVVVMDAGTPQSETNSYPKVQVNFVLNWFEELNQRVPVR
jgi:eukaryotic-like serine/threonine-protein kinase